MCGCNGGDHRHMRLHHKAQRGDFARVVHTNLKNSELRDSGHARQGQRHAPMVVVAGNRGMGASLILQHSFQHFFGGGLANRSGDGNHLSLTARPCGPTQGNQALQNIRHNQQGCILANPIGTMRHQSRSRPVSQGLSHKIMTITLGTQGYK